MELSSLEQAIIETLVFYDIFQIPLKKGEIFYFLFQQKCTQPELSRALNDLLKNRIISQKNNYYFLSGSQKNIEIREKRLKISHQRWDKVKKVIPWLGWIPFIKMIAVSNSLSFNNSHEDSDIDLFIITQKNRLWLTRALTVLFLDLIAQNKNFRVQANRFCLGFWVDESKLNLKKLLFQPNDIYFYYWLAHLRPVYNQDIYGRLINSNNWLKRYLPNWTSDGTLKILGEQKIRKFKILEIKKRFLEFIFGGVLGDCLESFWRNLQIKRVWADAKNSRQGASVIANRSILKLHAYDKRRKYQEKFEDRLKDFI